MTRSSERRIISFFVVVFLWSILDLASKRYIFSILTEPGQFLIIIPDHLRFTRVENSGAIWGQFAEFDTLLFYVNLFVIPFLFLFFLHSLVEPASLVDLGSRCFVVSLGLIMGGAMGNFYDRLMFGHVRDFIDVKIPVVEYRWPVFNVADAGITTGAVLLAFCILMYPPEEGVPDQSEG